MLYTQKQIEKIIALELNFLGYTKEQSTEIARDFTAKFNVPAMQKMTGVDDPFEAAVEFAYVIRDQLEQLDN